MPVKVDGSSVCIQLLHDEDLAIVSLGYDLNSKQY